MSSNIITGFLAMRWRLSRRRHWTVTIVSTALLLTGLAFCSVSLAMDRNALKDRPKSVWALTRSGVLFNVSQAAPATARKQVLVQGLHAGDTLVGIDYRVAYGDLYGMAQSGRIYVIDTRSGVARLVSGSAPVSGMEQGLYGFDFNPAADRLRVVGIGNLNLRLHPETGAVIDFDANTNGVQTDPKLAFDAQDAYAGEVPDVVAAAYTYNQEDTKLTTNYAIDKTRDLLVMQGTREGDTPAVSPNLGVLYTQGALGLGDIEDASMDISDVDNVALMSYRLRGDDTTRLAQIDLKTGKAQSLGVLGSGDPVVGMAIEP